MQIQSRWLASLQQEEKALERPALTCWYSNCDNVVFPASTATLPGADNRFVAGQPHVGLAFHPQVMDGCLQLVEQAEGARQGESVTETAPLNS
jgi:triacylglycerol lipase